jgi:alpha-tubulin suppressor-like RCC1 family protein
MEPPEAAGRCRLTVQVDCAKASVHGGFLVWLYRGEMARCPTLHRAMCTARTRSFVVFLCVVVGALDAGCGGSSRRAGGSSEARQALAPSVPASSRFASSVATIASGGFAGYALLTSGQVWAWGDDLEGQIGDGGAWYLSATPIEIPGLRGIVAIAAGANTAYALQSDGAILAWGDNSQDELGEATDSRQQKPQRIRAPGGIVAIAAGGWSAYALTRDGTIWAWGDDGLGQLGAAGSLPRAIPGRVPHLSGVIAIAAGQGNGYALRRDGTVWAWGDATLGQLGTQSCARSGSAGRGNQRCPAAGFPAAIRGLGSVTAIAAGADTAYALRRDGSVWAWGDDSFGALGSRVRRQFAEQPTRVRGLAHVVAIAAGSETAYAVLHDGSVWAWGRGVDGELGDGNATNRAVPTHVLMRAPVIQVAGGGAMAYALDRQGRIWAWGSGLYGQLGDGYLMSLDEPTRVLKLP